MDQEATLHVQYLSVEPYGERLCVTIRDQLEKLMTGNGIIPALPIEYRFKGWDSLSEKAKRLSGHGSSIENVIDLIGVRVTLMFPQDVERVGKLIPQAFVVRKKEDVRDWLREDQFGYSSIHYAIEISREWLNTEAIEGINGLSGEIQIRSVAQHVWAVVSHRLQYKARIRPPRQVLRSLYRLSALLEVVDLELGRLLEEVVVSEGCPRDAEAEQQ